MKTKYIYGKKRECLICGKSFQPRDKDSIQKCCSNRCRGKLQTQRAKRNCVTCGKSFLPAQPYFKNCSRKCGTAYRLSRKVENPMVEIRQRLAIFCCSVIARSLRGKTDTTKRMLGYSSEQLRKHLETQFSGGMTWKNYGKKAGQWSIDHKRPISKFSQIATIKEINALSNLQPLWHNENCRKRNQWEGR